MKYGLGTCRMMFRLKGLKTCFCSSNAVIMQPHVSGLSLYKPTRPVENTVLFVIIHPTKFRASLTDQSGHVGFITTQDLATHISVIEKKKARKLRKQNWILRTLLMRIGSLCFLRLLAFAVRLYTYNCMSALTVSETVWPVD
jgi:hypothetical protein